MRSSASLLSCIPRFLVAVVIVFPSLAFPQSPRDDTRSVRSREYAARLQKQIAERRPRSNQTKKKRLVKYAPAANNDVLVAEGVDVGVTLWRLRPAQKTDSREVQEPTRLPVRKKGKSEEKIIMMVPARAESETAFSDGDLLKLTIEPPFESYIYIIGREHYKDGRHSEPYLIFPANIDIGKHDKCSPGKLLFLPSENDDDKFELTRLNQNAQEKVAEVFTVILSQQSLKELPPLEKSDEPRRIDKQLFERWQNEWGGRVWKFERQGSAGASITRVEKNAGVKVGATLTGDDPPPQTVYHVARKATDTLLLFDISLKIRK